MSSKAADDWEVGSVGRHSEQSSCGVRRILDGETPDMPARLRLRKVKYLTRGVGGADRQLVIARDTLGRGPLSSLRKSQRWSLSRIAEAFVPFGIARRVTQQCQTHWVVERGEFCTLQRDRRLPARRPATSQ